MKKHLNLIFLVLAATACQHSGSIHCGIWKIQRVEIFQHDTLRKVIDTGEQFWSFHPRNNLDIFDRQHHQNRLRVSINDDCIISYDTTGQPCDEYRIERLNDHELQLRCQQSANDQEYNIRYYLGKVSDTLANELSLQNK